jgi:hypothetical protein
MIKLIEREKMISTAIAIQQATGEAVTDLSTMMKAREIYSQRDIMTEEEFARALFDYSAHLASLTATLVTTICLTETEIDEMIDTIKEFDVLGKDFN